MVLNCLLPLGLHLRHPLVWARPHHDAAVVDLLSNQREFTVGTRPFVQARLVVPARLRMGAAGDRVTIHRTMRLAGARHNLFAGQSGLPRTVGSS